MTKIINGERDLDKLTSYIDERVKTSKLEIQQALDGVLEEEDLDILKLLIKQVDSLEELIAENEKLIDRHLQPFEAEVNLLTTIPGVSKITATAIISEIGVDMSAFPKDEKLASWAAVCPGNNESAGKQKSGRTRRGNNFLKASLIQAAWAASKAKDSYFQGKYRRLAVRKGNKRAAMAIAHKILITSYHMLIKKVPYNELGAKFLDGLQTERKVKYHVKRLEELGYHINAVEKI
ncbi:MAG: transposase, partial [bacterium]